MVALAAFVYYLISNCFNINLIIIRADAISIIVRVPLSQIYVQLDLTHSEADSSTSTTIGIVVGEARE